MTEEKTLSERESITLRLRELYRDLNIVALVGNGDEANRIRDVISKLEERKQNLRPERNAND